MALRRHVVLARINEGQAEHRYIGAFVEDSLPLCAKVALEEGFSLLYELRSKPSMDEMEMFASGRPLASIDSLVQIWLLGVEWQEAQV